ncbi:hypothetical protein J6590_077618 [Homalodisca vitripennis]|nr:hypothetical protein J6590_077618 [Homalodisca vitripennis]
MLQEGWEEEDEDKTNDMPLLTLNLQDLAKFQEEDEECKRLMGAVRNPDSATNADRRMARSFVIENELLYKKNVAHEGASRLLVVPKSLRNELVIALDENSEESNEPIYVLCLTWCITLFMYVMWRSVVWLWRRRSSRRHVVTKGNKEPGGVGERPLAIPLATLHGKELRINIEENCAAEVTDTFSTGD